MANTQVIEPDLLKAVQQLGAKEFDAFLEQALALRNQPREPTLSPQETLLIKRINRGISEKLRTRYAQLASKLRKRTLTDGEHTELLKFTREVETLDAERAAALLELAKLRRVPVRTLMRQMGIKAAPIRG